MGQEFDVFGVGNLLCFWGFEVMGLWWGNGATACFCNGF